MTSYEKLTYTRN